MAAIRTHLYFSTFWSVRRPKFPLTEGHFVLRLNDPAIAFGTASAADLLHCYGRLRRILAAVKGATAAQLYMALNWQPVGDSLGEPVAETSTPTLHVFFLWPGSTTASVPLALPAHLRIAAGNTEELDAALRSRLGGFASAAGTANDPLPVPGPAGTASTTDGIHSSAPPHEPVVDAPRLGDPAPGEDRSWEPPGWEDRPFHMEPARPKPGERFRGGHWTAIPRSPAATLDRLDPGALTSLASTVRSLASHSRPAFQGVTLWATDEWDISTPATLHIFARQHGDESQLLAGFVAGGGLDVPLPPSRQGN